MIDTKNIIKIDEKFFGETSIILAKRGFGKSYTARVIIEDGLKIGATFLVIDPQDAYLNLEGFDYIDAESVKSASNLGILLSQSHKNVVIRMKRMKIQDQPIFLKVLLDNYKRHITKGIQTIVIDEIHKYAPEGEKTAAKDTIRGMFQENRSDGLGAIVVTQRISRLDKTILSQADHLVIGKVTSFRDKESIKNYIDDPKELDKIVKLKIGEFYMYGFDLETPVTVNIRKSLSQHSGGSPKNLLNEDKSLYSKYIGNIVKKHKGDNKMGAVSEVVDTTKSIIPSMDSFKSLSLMGMKMSLGAATSGMVGTLANNYIKSPIPYVSSRTLAAGVTTIVFYAGYKKIPLGAGVKDVLKYAAAGSSAFTVGSILFDVIAAVNVNIPPLAQSMIQFGTGAGGIAAAQTKADTNTNFAA